MDQSTGIFGSARTGNSVTDRNVGLGMGEGACRHRAPRLADRPMTEQRIPRHTQHFPLGFVGIGDEAAFDDVG
jgi:hypothetical protein